MVCPVKGFRPARKVFGLFLNALSKKDILYNFASCWRIELLPARANTRELPFWVSRSGSFPCLYLHKSEYHFIARGHWSNFDFDEKLFSVLFYDVSFYEAIEITSSISYWNSLITAKHKMAETSHPQLTKLIHAHVTLHSSIKCHNILQICVTLFVYSFHSDTPICPVICSLFGSWLHCFLNSSTVGGIVSCTMRLRNTVWTAHAQCWLKRESVKNYNQVVITCGNFLRFDCSTSRRMLLTVKSWWVNSWPAVAFHLFSSANLHCHPEGR